MAKTKFKKWYKDNATRLNARRRKRYKSDPVYREAQLASTRRWRKKTSKTRVRPQPKPKTHATIGEAATAANCSVESIRNFEKAGHIPRGGDGTHRRYTPKQVGLIKLLADFRKGTHYKSPAFEKGMAKILKKIEKEW